MNEYTISKLQFCKNNKELYQFFEDHLITKIEKNINIKDLKELREELRTNCEKLESIGVFDEWVEKFVIYLEKKIDRIRTETDPYKIDEIRRGIDPPNPVIVSYVVLVNILD